MTIQEFKRLGNENAPMVHTAGDDLPSAEELAASLSPWTLDELGRLPTDDEAMAYAQGWLDAAKGMNAGMVLAK